LKQALRERFPALAPVMPHLMFAVNAEYANDATVIPANAEVACIPPVSGG
jgi:molybdopterin converting factor small subunit